MTVMDRDPDRNRSEEIGTSREEPTEAAAGELLTDAFEKTCQPLIAETHRLRDEMTG